MRGSAVRVVTDTVIRMLHGRTDWDARAPRFMALGAAHKMDPREYRVLCEEFTQLEFHAERQIQTARPVSSRSCVCSVANAVTAELVDGVRLCFRNGFPGLVTC